MRLENKAICPEDTLRVLLPAHKIPDFSVVTKRTGAKVYTLRHKLKVFTLADRPPIEIEGFFLVSPDGNANQIKEDLDLLWHIDVEEFYECIGEIWDHAEDK